MYFSFRPASYPKTLLRFSLLIIHFYLLMKNKINKLKTLLIFYACEINVQKWKKEQMVFLLIFFYFPFSAANIAFVGHGNEVIHRSLVKRKFVKLRCLIAENVTEAVAFVELCNLFIESL